MKVCSGVDWKSPFQSIFRLHSGRDDQPARPIGTAGSYLLCHASVQGVEFDLDVLETVVGE